MKIGKKPMMLCCSEEARRYKKCGNVDQMIVSHDIATVREFMLCT